MTNPPLRRILVSFPEKSRREIERCHFRNDVAESKKIRALLEEADECIEEDDKNGAIELYKQAAKLGSACAQYNLGVAYHYYYCDVKFSKTRSLRCFRDAAENGYCPAQCALGDLLYLRGKKKVEYLKWYARAAVQKNDYAYCRLEENVIFIFYHDFANKKYNKPNTISKLKKIAKKGNTKAALLLGIIYYYHLKDSFLDLSNPSFYFNRCKAKKWFKHADTIDLISTPFWNFIHGYTYDKCDFDDVALNWLNTQADLGSAEAQLYLGKYYASSFGEHDYAKAIKWFALSAEQENADALYELAKCYYEGCGVAKDYDKAVELFITFFNVCKEI